MLLKSALVMLCMSCAACEVIKVAPEPNITISPGPAPTTVTTAKPTTPTTLTPPTTPTTPTPPTTPTTPTTPTPPTTPTTPTTPTPPTTPTTPTTPTPPTTPSTTTAVPSPTPKPADKPAINNYTGNYTGTNHICLMVKVAVQLEVLANKNSSIINVPTSVNYTATCPSNSSELLTVVWGAGNNISFGFFNKGGQYEISSINVTLTTAGGNSTQSYYHIKNEFVVPDKLSYYCIKDQALNLTDGQSNETLAKVHLSNFQYQAFMNTTNAAYSSVWDCDGANTPDIVPVVVGCVLAVLVVLVLVVYLFGRRRCQVRGYLSM